MSRIRLKHLDGSVKEAELGTTGKQIAEGFGQPLADAAIAAKLDGKVVDLSSEIPPGEHTFQVLTDKDPESLEVLRHSSAHVLARAVLRVFPNTKLAFGPATENGYYYDIDSSPQIREEDFPRIEAEMRRIAAQAEPFERFECSIPEGRALLNDLRQDYKVEHIDESLKQFPTVSFYRQGEFVDLCRGPHLPDAGRIKAFKLLSIAGAYWKNDSSRKQLQRLYGTAFFSQKDLDAYLKRMEEAKKRDHRVLGKQLKLFMISPQVGSGLILWKPKGATVRGILESFIKDELLKRGYQPVYSPHIGRLELYRTSGHFPYYRDAQFPPMYFRPAAGALDLAQWRLAGGELDEAKEKAVLAYFKEAQFVPPGYLEANTNAEKLELVHHHVLRILDGMNLDLPEYRMAETPEERAQALLAWLSEQEGYLLKPMNCPHHIQIYKDEPRSYRDLPVRLAEFGTVYRFEQTGELSGMTRVRGFTQDDAHLFITPEQIEEEVRANIELVLFVLSSLGLNDYRVRVGLRQPGSGKYVGSDENWNNAENALLDIVKNLGMNYTVERGEAAFYGPKTDFVVRDCIGREWQLGTVQLDYNLPERFGLEYVGADNRPHRLVMIHRAPFGSMERFMGILIEHFAGAFPLWLAPEQVRVLTVSDKVREYGEKVERQLRDKGFRVTGDYRPDKIGAKIREAQVEKIPYMLIVGQRESDRGEASVRNRTGKDMGAMPVAQVIGIFQREVEERSLTLLAQNPC